MKVHWKFSESSSALTYCKHSKAYNTRIKNGQEGLLLVLHPFSLSQFGCLIDDYTHSLSSPINRNAIVTLPETIVHKLKCQCWKALPVLPHFLKYSLYNKAYLLSWWFYDNGVYCSLLLAGMYIIKVRQPLLQHEGHSTFWSRKNMKISRCVSLHIRTKYALEGWLKMSINKTKIAALQSLSIVQHGHLSIQLCQL